ncbi:M16 family metallopeptidase [Kushneria phosphatilytica]|uniref:Insulinase family protein n=1 Tax=Kushneria phosphatilytica TaxID=657387 RepID=A0A1S1NSQ9_9GAMM|nr:pitrilysin family protein [Kushneria phosphatilytica]OHV08383.1 peptidase M16 [Kushneria phosphatilytica]QEL09805.1 insulinase family protein [Kushneria phosphatilytica]
MTRLGRGALSALWLALGVVLATPALADDTHDVLRSTLDNGLKVVVVHSDLAPVVTTQMNYRVGSSEAPEGFPGMAHATEHMMFRGSPGLSKDQLSAISASMGGSMNAFTAQDMTQYHFTVPSNDLDVALHIEAARMQGLDLDAEDWQQERGAIEQEVSGDLSNPSFRFYTQLVDELFRGTPYAHTPLGTRESFDNTTVAQLRAFYHSWYVPNNAVLVIAGDVDPEQTLSKVKSLFGDIPRKPLPERPEFGFSPVKGRSLELSTNNPYGAIYMAWRLPGLRSDEFATAKIMLDALGSQRGALAAMGFNGTALAGGMGGRLMPHAGLAMAYGAFSAGGDPAPIRQRMRDIIRQFASDGIDPALVEAAKRQAIAAIESRRNSISGLAGAWSQALVEQGVDSPEKLIARIQAVTPEQVDTLARRVLNPDQAIVATLTPKQSGEPVAKQGYGQPEQFGTPPDEAVELPQWASQAFAKLDIPVSTLDPTDMHLSNGIRLIVQPEHASQRLTLIGGIDTNADLQAGAGKAGVAELLDGLYQYGSAKHDRLELQRRLDAIGADESAGSSFSLSVAKQHFEQGVKLLAEHEQHPNFSKRAFSILKQQNASSLPGYLNSPDFLNGQAMQQALLPKNDPALRHMTPESIRGLTLENVRDYFHKAYRPDMTTIVVVGDITPEHARKVIEQHFGNWQASGAKPETEYPAVPLNKASRFHTPDSSARQASVSLAEMVDVTRDSPARFALYLGNQILSGDFSSRLHRALREQRGLVYGVGSSFGLQARRGSFEVNYGSDPDKVEQARSLILQNLKRMQNAPVSADELHRAKGTLLRQMPLNESSYGAIGGQLLSLSLNGKPLDASTRAAKHYLELTPQAIQQAWREYIRPDDLVTGVRGPSSGQ